MIDCYQEGGVDEKLRVWVDCLICGHYKFINNFSICIAKEKHFQVCNSCAFSAGTLGTKRKTQTNKFQSGTYYNIYKWDCIKKIRKLKIGQSFTVEDRCKSQVQRDWLLNIARYSSRKYKVTSIDKKNQVVTRIS